MSHFTVIPAIPDGLLRLVPVQRMNTGGRWRTEAMRSYRTPLMLWFTRGQGRITVAGRTRGYGPHNAIFIPAGTMHGFEVSGKVFGTAIFFAESTPDLPAEPCHLRIREARQQGEVTALIDAMQREVDADRPLKERAVAHHAGLLSVWIARQRALAGEREAESEENGLARRYTEVIEEQLYTGQTMKDFAEMLGVAPTHLSDVCHRTCGRRAADLLADRIAFEARKLMLDSAMPVERVSEVLGFADPREFDKAFRAQTGQSPDQFRRERIAADAQPGV